MTPHVLLLALTVLSAGDPPTPAEIVSALESVTIDAIAKAQPSVVAIARVLGDDPDKTTAIRGTSPPPAVVGLDGEPKKPPFMYAAPGDFFSGVVIGGQGEILTTYHSLRGSSEIWVRTEDKQEFQAEILAADPRSDLAVIAPRLAGENRAPKLKPIKIGDADKMRPGTFLIALGNPYNAARDGKASAGWGILSNTARRIHPPQASEVEAFSIRTKYFRYQPTLLQLDAKLNLGMSGGAVVNMKGELVGLTTAAASPVAYDVQAGYALPMDALGRKVVDALKQGKEAEYGFLGISLNQQIPNCVETVGQNTPADRARLLRGDVILAVGDQALSAEDGLTMALALVPVGQNVKLKIRRNGEIQNTTIFVSKYPVEGQVIAVNRPKPWRGIRVDFSSAVPAINALERMKEGGVAIMEVETGSPAEVAGLRKYEVVTEVDGERAESPAAFLKLVAAKDGKDVTLTTQIGMGRQREVVVKK